MEVARRVATALRTPAQVQLANRIAAGQTAYPEAMYWDAYGVAQGHAGLALMCSYLDACFPADRWDVTAHRYLTLAARGIQQTPDLGPGIFEGLSGVGFTGWSLSRNGVRYRRLLAVVDNVLLPQIPELVDALDQQREGLSVTRFDVISGLAGVGAYLLCRRDRPEADGALHVILRGLVQLTIQQDDLPRWYTPACWMGDGEAARMYPHGNLNCGLAHGIAGPLALMALSARCGVASDDLFEGMERVVQWLRRHRVDDTWGVNWPAVVPLDRNGAPGAAEQPSRSAWCYGSPGIARALWLAGEALSRPEYSQLAIAAMKAVYRRPLQQRRIDSPTFCHGVAGLLQITLRFAHDTGLPLFVDATRRLGEQLLSMHDPASLLGYDSLEPEGQRVAQPGLLDGAAGVALVLLAAATDVEPVWDRLFLLA